MKSWEAKIPTTPKNKDVKRCYTVWNIHLKTFRVGGKVVWLTDAQLTFARIKYSNKEFELVLERDRLEECKKYINQTIE